MKTYFKRLASDINVVLSDDQIDKFFKYKCLLKERNAKFNLTAIVDDREIILKHFVDSLSCVKFISDNSSVIDVGTGAGFPGLPIKFVLSGVKLTLLDSLNKRINFLNEVVASNGLDGVNCVHGRAEDIARLPEYRECFDFAVARAVANLSTLAELCLPFLKIGGSFVCMKGSCDDELIAADRAISLLGGKVEVVDKFLLPDSDIERTIIVIKKVSSSPKVYPRKAGVPAKKPLF